MESTNDILKIGDREFTSRLFVGTGKFSSNDLMLQSILASKSEMITVAMKRINMDNEADDDMLKHINRDAVQFLPNTSGVRDAEEAVLAAQLSRECFGTNFIKLEIHPNPKYLLPDPVERPETHPGAQSFRRSQQSDVSVQSRSRPLLCSSQMKKGPPARAMTMPTGIS